MPHYYLDEYASSQVFGNALVQERTEKYIEQKGRELIDLLCNETGAMQGLVDLGMLKFKERDELENVFKGWNVKQPFKVSFGFLYSACIPSSPLHWQVVELLDTRLRAMYGQRFDAKKNLIDWDYRQGYGKVGVPQCLCSCPPLIFDV